MGAACLLTREENARRECEARQRKRNRRHLQIIENANQRRSAVVAEDYLVAERHVLNVHGEGSWRLEIGSNEDRCPAQATGTERRQRSIRFAEREAFDFGAYRHPRCQREKLLTITAGEICDGAYRSLTPENLIRKARDVAHVNARADNDASLRRRTECR